MKLPKMFGVFFLCRGELAEPVSRGENVGFALYREADLILGG